MDMKAAGQVDIARGYGSRREGAGTIERGGLEMRLAPSLPVPLRAMKCGFLQLFCYRRVPWSRSVSSRGKPSSANLGAMSARQDRQRRRSFVG
jgi:hypothetical protein